MDSSTQMKSAGQGFDYFDQDEVDVWLLREGGGAGSAIPSRRSRAFSDAKK
jgi:hypothetical protein